uniref:SAND domain-containing protein n=1 Tax=Sinocyclocheilus rhinocerous TaxID=307959 RepID=A0A673FWA3_9TELE
MLSAVCLNAAMCFIPLENDAEDFQEQGWRGVGTEIRGRVEEEEEEEDMADLSVFQAPSLPVTCVSLTGTLYKYRFATGIRGKCIRTEERWFTPEEFVKQEPTVTDGHWKKDILCHGKTLNFLLKVANGRDTQEEDVNNDDECYVCHSEGHLVCCDECPRAFHSHCHLPAVHGDSPGEWICTFSFHSHCHLPRQTDRKSLNQQVCVSYIDSVYMCVCLLVGNGFVPFAC